jgi:hypothetical protein
MTKKDKRSPTPWEAVSFELRKTRLTDFEGAMHAPADAPSRLYSSSVNLIVSDSVQGM